MAAVAALLLATTAAAAQDTRPGVYPGARETHGGFVRTSELVPVRDGVRLAVTVYRPTRGGRVTNERLPVLFSFTPYLSRRIDADGTVVGTLEAKSPRGRPFAELTRYGYVIAVADVRGKGSSFGVRAGYADQHEGEDGHDLVEWLAAQPYANGKVGMFGCSYVGGTQWATARNTPPHLRAIFPQAAQFDSYRNVRRGGLSGQFNTRPQGPEEDLPTAPVDADRDGSLREAALAQHARNGQMMDLVGELAFRDDRTRADDIQYWPLSSPYPKIDAMRRAGIAVYSWGNWMDEPADQALIGYENMRGAAPARLIMGPGGHCDVDTIDSFAEHLRWFDHVLKGVDNGIDREPPIWFKTIGLPEASAWRFASKLPLSDTPATRYYLAAAARLSDRRPRAARDAYQVTYAVGCTPPAWAMPGRAVSTPPKPGALPEPGFWPCVNPAVAKGYVTAPMTQAMWLSGFGIVNLTLSSDSRDVPVFGYLEDVAADGSATLITHGRLLASHRKLGEAPYPNLGLPWHSNARVDAAPLAPGEVATLRFELSPTSRIIAAGHSLRFSITGADQRQRNLAQLKQDPPPRIDLRLGGADASYIDLTLAPASVLAARR
ncbi:CocE/NonD family hydrolase [Sphingomonas guangdongensis]|nr:CocE/NonD family hydrolase [Sphingomonas guangdongensis]